MHTIHRRLFALWTDVGHRKCMWPPPLLTVNWKVFLNVLNQTKQCFSSLTRFSWSRNNFMSRSLMICQVLWQAKHVWNCIWIYTSQFHIQIPHIIHTTIPNVNCCLSNTVQAKISTVFWQISSTIGQNINFRKEILICIKRNQTGWRIFPD